MKTHRMFSVLSSSVVCILLISGCFGNQPKTTIQDILAKAQDTGPVQYDVITTSIIYGNASNLTKHIWESPPYMKINISADQGYSIFILRPDGVYHNTPGTNEFSRSNITFPEPSLIDQSTQLLNMSYHIVGNETFEGHATTILQYSESNAGNSITTKEWIWNDKGIPLKTQITYLVGGQPMVSTTMVNTNFVFGPIPMSEFNVNT